MAFAHPLARAAKVWTARGQNDGEQRILVVVTTIPLDKGHKRYKKALVDKLSRAVQDYLNETKEAGAYLLINRLREWRHPGPELPA
jgi:hypothetical protein